MRPKKIPVKEKPKEKREAERQRRREYHLMRLYGITQDQYDDLLKRQEHKCAVCQKHESEFKTRLHVDHDHKTGEIRGLLCNHCNHRVVGRHTDRSLIYRVYEYLGSHTGWFVPPKFRTGNKRRRKKK